MLSGIAIFVFLLSACAAPVAPAPDPQETQAPLPASSEEPAQASTAEASSEASQASGGTITFWMMKTFVDASNEMIAARVKEFENANNVTVDLRMIAIDDLPAQWSAAIESGDVPDVTYCGYEDAGKFYNLGVLADISDVIAQVEKDYGPLNEPMVKAVTFDGKQYGMPMWAEPTVLYYRKDLFEKAGIAAPPENWDDFLADAKKLTDPASGIYGAGFGLGRDNSDSEWWMRDIIWSYGGALFAKDGKSANADSPQTAEALQWLKDFWTTENVTPPGVIGWDDGGNNAAWLAGQVAMVMNTGSIYNKMVEEKMDLLNQTGLALVPAGPEGRYITGISNNLCIFKNAKDPNMGKKLIAFMSDKDWQREWMKVGSYLIIPPYVELGEDPFWQTEVGKVFASVPEYFAFLGYPGDYSPVAGEVANTRLLTDAMEKVVVQNQPIDQVLKDLNAQIDALLAQ